MTSRVGNTRRRVLVLWADTESPNLGLQALAAGTKEVILSVCPTASVDIQSYRSGPAPTGLRPTTAALGFLRIDSTLVDWLSEYDLIVDTGSGDSFTNIYGWRRFLTMAGVRRLAIRSGCTVILGPQTIGPFNSTLARLIARLSLRGVRQIFARDSTSTCYAADTLRRRAESSTDTVFALSKPRVGTTRDVVFNVSGLLWVKNPHVDYELYRREAVRYCRNVMEHGHGLSLLAHVLPSGNPDSDQHAMEQLAAMLPGTIERYLPQDLADVRAYIASCRLTVGSRMHACLNSLSLGVPTIAWAYSRKFEPLLNDIGWTAMVDLRAETKVADCTLALSTALLSARAESVVPVLEQSQARLEPFRSYLKD